MINIYSPANEIELAMLKGILEGEGILFFVHNDNFGSMEIGPQIALFNKKTIMVDEADAERARQLFSDFLTVNEEEPESKKEDYSLLEKVRMVLEALLFTWFVPGKRKR